MPSRIQRRANHALGMCVLSLLALMETVFADQKNPNTASLNMWSVLGVTSFGALVDWLRHRGHTGDLDASHPSAQSRPARTRRAAGALAGTAAGRAGYPTQTPKCTDS